MLLSPRLKTILSRFTIILTLCFTLGVGLCAYAFFDLENDMTKKLESKKFLVPTEYFAAPVSFSPRMLITQESVIEMLKKRNYRMRAIDQRILPGDFYSGNRAECSSRLGVALDEKQLGCIVFVNSDVQNANSENETQTIVFQTDGSLSQVFKGVNPIAEVSLEAPLLAQYIGNEPLMQTEITLGQTPTQCLNAIISMEDNSFLEHGGVSYKGIFRAIVKNITSRRSAQGGSTITQQLVKNYFLTSEKTLKRKAQELIMSIMLESRFTKDEILETYINIIYMGQNGAFQVRGYGSAAKYYFGKDLAQLNISECSLLAAIINSPGLYNPFKKPDNARKRRGLVLDKMLELKFITDEELKIAKESALPTATPILATETAPYYIDAVRKQMAALNIPVEGKKIYTALDLDAQNTAQEALQGHLEQLEKKNKSIKALKEKGNSLEGMVLSGDPKTGLISTVIGGRNFRMTQFNRAIDGHRQVGSIMKPFVFLTALENKNKEGQDFTPISLLSDEKFTTKYDKQSWTPENYGKKYFGQVPMFFALKNSLNAATASLGLEVGLDKIVETNRLMGVESDLKALPSITLGAFELYPREVLQAYMAFSQMGQRVITSFIRKVVDNSNKEVYTYSPAPIATADPAAVASLVSMMKQTILSGSARAVILNGFTHPAAGKTGTTNDYKDAWFGGFTPYVTTIVWVGFDRNLTHNLSGSSGAVPIWTQFMKKVATRYPADDFAWPENTEVRTLDEATLRSLNAIKEEWDPFSVDLVFKK